MIALSRHMAMGKQLYCLVLFLSQFNPATTCMQQHGHVGYLYIGIQIVASSPWPSVHFHKLHNTLIKNHLVMQGFSTTALDLLAAPFPASSTLSRSASSGHCRSAALSVKNRPTKPECLPLL